jgi:hypothetical protein
MEKMAKGRPKLPPLNDPRGTDGERKEILTLQINNIHKIFSAFSKNYV